VPVKRVCVIVDGLNLMHALMQQNPNLEYLNLVDLANRLVKPRSEVLVEIKYFSAIASHISDWGQEKQNRYIESLKNAGVKVVLGHFHHIRQVCTTCGTLSKRHLEKQTDVAIASAIIEGAYENKYDKLLLFSADSDLIPAVDLVKAKFAAKEIKIVSTIAYLRPVHATMGRKCDGQIRLTPEFIAPHLIDYETE
jgi:uncharacterized LabA/DUF88 family protein